MLNADSVFDGGEKNGIKLETDLKKRPLKRPKMDDHGNEEKLRFVRGSWEKFGALNV